VLPHRAALGTCRQLNFCRRTIVSCCQRVVEAARERRATRAFELLGLCEATLLVVCVGPATRAAVQARKKPPFFSEVKNSARSIFRLFPVDLDPAVLVQHTRAQEGLFMYHNCPTLTMPGALFCPSQQQVCGLIILGKD
jgi:uroporphyrinogen-III synthase